MARKRALSEEQIQALRDYILQNPSVSEREIAKKFKISNATAHKYVRRVKEGLGKGIEEIILNPKKTMSETIDLYNTLREKALQQLAMIEEQEEQTGKLKTREKAIILSIVKDLEKEKQELLMKWGFQPNKAFETIGKIGKVIYEVVKKNADSGKED